MNIYLADLGDNVVTVTSDIYPLGIANLASYAMAFGQSKEPLEIRIFLEPQDLKAALDRRIPDVLGLSSYAWNHNLSLHPVWGNSPVPCSLKIFGVGSFQ